MIVLWAGVISQVKMEKSLFISKPANIKYWNKDYTRIYFGIEFCEVLLPDEHDLTHVLDFVDENNLNFTFVTPFVTDKGISKLRILFKSIKKHRIYKKDIEIVINDFGVLRLLQNSRFKILYGRLLNKQKRDPRIIDLMKSDKELAHEFNDMYFDYEPFIRFLKSNRITRVEIDNLLEGINFNLPKGIHGSLYLPYIYVSTTRMCLFNNKDGQAKINGCKKGCQYHRLKQSSKRFKKEIILAGNTQFIYNPKISYNTKDSNIDRIVFQPDIPM